MAGNTQGQPQANAEGSNEGQGQGNPAPNPNEGQSNEPNEPNQDNEPAEKEEELSPEALATRVAAGETSLELLQRLATNALGDQVILQDAQRLVAQALPSRLGVENWACDLMAATTDVAVFMCWGEPNLQGMQQIRYSVNNQGVVEFTGDPEPVNLMTKIMPRQTGGVSANSGSTNQENGAMAENTGQENQNQPNAGEGGSNAGEGAGTGQAPANEPQVHTAPSIDDFLKTVPGPIGNVLRSLVDGAGKVKENLIGQIKANARNTFTDEQLAGMDLDQLQAVARLATPEPSVNSFEGRSGFGFGLDPLSVNQGSRAQGPQVMEANTDYLIATPTNGAQ